MICPLTMKPCIDDLCRSGSCFRCGESPLTECACGKLVGVDGSDPLDPLYCRADLKPVPFNEVARRLEEVESRIKGVK